MRHRDSQYRFQMAQSVSSRGDGIPSARRDLLLVALILVAVDAAAAAFLVYVYFPARRDEALARAPAQLSLLARDRQNALAGWVTERLSDAALTASLLDTRGIERGTPDLLDHFMRAYKYETAIIVDDNGAVALRRGSGDTDIATIRDFIRPPRKESGPWIDFRRTANRKPKILTACRLKNATVVYISDPYDYIYPFFDTVNVASKTGETNLIGLHDDWGIGLTPYRSGSPPPMTVRARIPRQHVAEVLALGERSITMIDRRGIPVIGVVKAIPRTPWLVFAKIDQDEVVGGAVDETVRLGQLLAFVSLMLATTAFVILRSRRVHKMRVAEDQLARLYENTTTGIIVLRVLRDEKGSPADHQVVDMNPAAAQLFGVIAGEEIGKRSADAPYLQWPPDIRALNYQVALTGRTTQYERYDARTERWYDTRCFSPLPGQVAQLLADVTDRRKSEEAVRHLSARVLRVQDETQRRIARDLHETVAQSLAGLRMNLGAIKQNGGGEIIDDSLTIVDDAMAEVRTMSYLLHPPMIDQAGLVTALRWYVEGFQQRSGIATKLDAPEDLGRLPRDLETVVFRIVQESLTNVQRHSGSSIARVAVKRSGDHLRIEIADEGRGLPLALRNDRSALLAAGVGIAGINERVHEISGDITIQSSRRGRRSASRCR